VNIATGEIAQPDLGRGADLLRQRIDRGLQPAPQRLGRGIAGKHLPEGADMVQIKSVVLHAPQGDLLGGGHGKKFGAADHPVPKELMGGFVTDGGVGEFPVGLNPERARGAFQPDHGHPIIAVQEPEEFGQTFLGAQVGVHVLKMQHARGAGIFRKMDFFDQPLKGGEGLEPFFRR